MTISSQLFRTPKLERLCYRVFHHGITRTIFLYWHPAGIVYISVMSNIKGHANATFYHLRCSTRFEVTVDQDTPMTPEDIKQHAADFIETCIQKAIKK